MKVLSQFVLPGCMRLGMQYERSYYTVPANKEIEDNSQLPRVSIVVPSYNQGDYIQATLESIVQQGYPNLELIVIDGGSTDNSVDIIRQFESQITYWVSEPDNGQTHAINKGFEHATGEILAWLNSDDLMLPGALNTAINYFRRNPVVDVVYGQRLLIDEVGQTIGHWIVANSHGRVLPYADYIPQETLFWRRRAWDKVGNKLDESFQFAMDWDLLLRFKRNGLKFSVINRFMGAFRFHAKQKTVADIQYTGFVDMERLRNRWATEIGKQRYSKRLMQLNIIVFLIRTRIKEILWRFGVVGRD